MKAGAAALLAAAVCVLGQACGGPGCTGSYPLYLGSILLTQKDSGAIVPVARYQSIGVLLPGSGRKIEDSDNGRLRPYQPTVCQPPDKTYVAFTPTPAEYSGHLVRLGGKVEISAPADSANKAWHVTVIIGTDPEEPGTHGTYSGRGTVLMSPGQSFVVSWIVGGRAPVVTNLSVLAPAGPAITVHSPAPPIAGFEHNPPSSFTQQLFVATGYGTAEIDAPDALPLGCNTGIEGGCPNVPIGPSQNVFVQDDYGSTCSLDGGCEQSKTDAFFWPGGISFPPPSSQP